MAGQDLSDLMRTLAEDPALLAQVRGLVLGDAYARLPETLASITERIGALTSSQDRTDAHIAALVDAQTRTDGHIAALTARVDALAARVDALAVQVEALTETVAELARGQATLVDRVGELSGMVLELRFKDRAAGFFQRVARRVRVLSPDELDDLLDPALADGRLTETECESIRHTDIVARARRRTDGAEILLAVEVSWGIGPSDVERAVSRAGLLTSLGVEAVPVVAGSWITPEAASRASDAEVAIVFGGTIASSAA